MRSSILVIVIFTALSGARADECSREEMAMAKPHFNLGAKAFRVGELQTAAEEFKAAYEACPSPLFLYNLGQTYRQLKDSEKALYFYKQFLSTTSAADERRADVQRLIGQLQSQTENDRFSPKAPSPTVARPAPPSASRAPTVGHPTTADLAVAQQSTTIKRPAYKQWWLWTVVGVVAAGVAVGIILGVDHTKSSPYTAPGVTF